MPAKAPLTSPKGAQPPRLRANLARALHILATEATTQRDAAIAAGINEKALSRALGRPAVKMHLESLKAQALLAAADTRKMARAWAIHVGMDLMRNAQSEAVRARMVEFFAGDPSGTGPSVVVNVGQAGYAYAPPGSRIVDITPAAPDTVSGDAAQIVEHEQGDSD